jgi:signal transduction histidine kinase
VALDAIVAQAVEMSRPLIESRRHELLISLPPEPVRWTADPVRMTQVLSNLLNNAAKYTEPGGRIYLDAERGGDDCESGCGTPGSGSRPSCFRTFSTCSRRRSTLRTATREVSVSG